MDTSIEKKDGRATVSLSGRFDIMSNLAFRNATKPLLADGEVSTLVIDFAKVQFVDSSGLGLLLLLREQAQAAGKDIILAHCGPDLQRVLSIAQFNKIFRLE